MIELEKDPAAPGLGIILRGNKDGSRARMSVYVADIEPQGPAGVDGRILVGDELLEVRRTVNGDSKGQEVMRVEVNRWEGFGILKRIIAVRSKGRAVGYG